jgi:hypothetical protein
MKARGVSQGVKKLRPSLKSRAIFLTQRNTEVTKNTGEFFAAKKTKKAKRNFIA